MSCFHVLILLFSLFIWLLCHWTRLDGHLSLTLWLKQLNNGSYFHHHSLNTDHRHWLSHRFDLQFNQKFWWLSLACCGASVSALGGWRGCRYLFYYYLLLLGDLFYTLKTTLLGSGKACVLDFEWYSKTLTPRQSCACSHLGMKAPSLYGTYPVCEAWQRRWPEYRSASGAAVWPAEGSRGPCCLNPVWMDSLIGSGEAEVIS